MVAVTENRYPGIHQVHIQIFVLFNNILSFCFYRCSILHSTRSFHSQYTYQEIAITHQKNKCLHTIFFVADILLFLYCMRCHV